MVQEKKDGRAKKIDINDLGKSGESPDPIPSAGKIASFREILEGFL